MFNNWEELEEECKKCTKCKLSKARKNVVIGTGNKEADLMFIGEGPGADEDMQGIPFVGRAGKLMNMAFKGLGINREDVYIANVVKCRPPNNRNPEDDESRACLDYLRNQVILGKEYSITSARGKWVEKNGILYMPTFHPAALLRDESKKILFWRDLKLVLKRMEEIQR